MAESTPPRQMSLIPYANNGEVVLRRGNAVVVYDSQSHELSVRNASEQALEITECPYCKRPLRDDFQREAEDHGRPLNPERPFVDPDYFAMLARSQRASPASSTPGTPSRRLHVPALRSGRSRNVSGSTTAEPPTGAEFVGSAPSASGQGISSSAFTPGYFKQHFREECELGRGGNGVVLLVEHTMDGISLGHFACKRVPVGNDHSWLEKVLVEVRLLSTIPHKNLVAYHWVWLEDYQPSKFGPSIPCLWILQEYCNGGDLHGYVTGPKSRGSTTTETLKEKFRRNSKGDVSPPRDLTGPSKLVFDDIFSFFRDITSGLHHLHSKGYIHRDLKPSNCLLQRDGNRTRVLISDFGEVQAAGAKRGNTGATGTISFCAPEVLRQDASERTFGNFTTKSDIFSLGMIVYFMCFGRLPYVSTDGIDEEKEDLEELRAEILAWSGFSDETRTRTDLPEKLYRFLRRLLSVDPNERPSTEEILQSIKAGAGLNEAVSSILEDDGLSRVSSLDEASRRPTPQSRTQSAYFGTPGLPTTRRKSSETRSLSPSKKLPTHVGSASSSQSRPGSREDSRAVVRPRKVDLPAASTSPPQMSPRLMLPPPPPERSAIARIRHVAHHPNAMACFRAALFLAKLLSLFLPCSPYAANPWLLYPLLVLAALDVGFLDLAVKQSLLLLAAHLGLAYSAQKQGRLCSGHHVVWEQY